MRRFVYLVLLLVLTCCSFLTPVRAGQLIYNNAYGDAYGRVLQAALEGKVTCRGAEPSLIGELNEGAAGVEAYATQTEIYLKNPAYHWYPQYLATVVLAVDRDVCREDIYGWQDVLKTKSKLCVPLVSIEYEYCLMALAYGLSGGMDTSKAVDYLKELQGQGLLLLASPDGDYSAYLHKAVSPAGAHVYVLFDYQAVQLNKSGRHLQIIVPREGTLTFPKGILARQPLDFNRDVLNKTLLAEGFRPVDLHLAQTGTAAGQSTAAGGAAWPEAGGSLDASYPRNRDYLTASRVQDPQDFTVTAEKLSTQVRRQVLGLQRFVTADGYEHQASYLVLLIIIIFIFGTVLRKVLHPGVRRALLGLGISVLLTALLRLVKLVIPTADEHIVRWLWYAAYIFFFSMSLFLVWIAWATGRPLEEKRPPVWWYALVGVSLLSVLIILTNDLHQLVWGFRPDFKDSWAVYSHQPLFYVFSAEYLLMILGACLFLVYQVWDNSFMRRKAILPQLVLLSFFVYLGGNNLGWPLFKYSEINFTFCRTMVLFVLAATYAGLFNTNSNYQEIFSASTLGLRIMDREGAQVFGAASIPKTGNNVAVHRMPVTGGQVVWYEDIRDLNDLEHKLALTTEALARSRNLLAQEEQVRGAYTELKIRNQLYDELELVITHKYPAIMEDLNILRNLERKKETKIQAVCHLNILSCYLKKRCVLLLLGKERNTIDVQDIKAAFTESCLYAKQSGINSLFQSEIAVPRVGSLEAMFIYDLFEVVLETAFRLKADNLLVRLAQEQQLLKLNMLLSGDQGSLLTALQALSARQEFAGRQLEVKDLDDAVAVTLTLQGIIS